MKLKLNTMVDYFLFAMLAIKLVFLVSAVGHVITVRSSNPKINQHERLMARISDTTEMLFIFGMSLFLIYHFFPNKKSYPIDKETAVLLFAYGFVMLVSALKRYHVPRPLLQRLEKQLPARSASSSSSSE